jgi:CBS domain-containing protein
MMQTTVQDLLCLKGDAVWAVEPDTTVLEALQVMAEKGIGAILVLSDGGITGILSERDVARRIAADAACNLDAPVRDVMTERVITVQPSRRLEVCMALMTGRRIRHLPVVTDDGDLVGLVSIGDVVRAVITSQERTIDQLSKYIEGGGYNQ